MVKVSVTIPIYNTGKYLAECIESVINQSLKDIEIILVDDGSPDNAGKICDEYALKDSRIKVFHQENQGVAAARNTGLENATGEYLYFLDSDDMIEENFLEYAYNVAKANDSDLTICDERNYSSRSVEFLATVATYGIFVRHEFLKLHPDIKFPVGIQPSEDGIFSHKILLLTDKISFCNNKYFYRHYPEQNTYRVCQNQQLALPQAPEFFKILEEFYDKYNLWDKHYLKIIKTFEFELFANRNKFKGCALFDRIKIANLNNKFFKKHLKKYLTKAQAKKFNYEFIKLLYSMNGCTFIFNRFLHSIPLIQDNYLAVRFLANYFKTNIKKLIYKLARAKAKIKVIHPSERKFLKQFFNNIDADKVLVVEMNNCHNEVIPGYLKYLNELGYRCDVLVEKQIYKDNIFVNLPDNLYENIYNARYFIIQKILKSPEVKKYKKIFITSNYIYAPKVTLSDLPNLQDKEKFIFTEHNIKYLTDDLMKCHKFLCINNFGKSELQNNVVNPHYFGDINITEKNKDITKFLVVGRIKNDRQNYSMIYDSINDLKAKNIFNYKITLVGYDFGGYLDRYLLCERNLEYKGKLNFAELYKEIEDVDFFITLFDDSNPEHQKYKTTVTSGQIQLIYGFLKPTIIQKNFAPYCGFDKENSILFENKDDLTDALIKCINMQDKEYKKIQDNIKNYSENLYQKSLTNLKGILND